MPTPRLDELKERMLLALMINFSVRAYEDKNERAQLFIDMYFKARQTSIINFPRQKVTFRF